jgi:hypothetical protein
MTQVRVGWRAYVSPVGGSTGTDTDAQAFITAAAITDSVQVSALNTLVTDLKTYGLWTKMKALYPFVGGSAASHKFNLKDPRDLDAAYRLVFNGGWIHSTTGAKPNGTTGYANTFLIPSSNYPITWDISMGFYSRTNIAEASNDLGTYQTSTQCLAIQTRWSGAGGSVDTIYSQVYADISPYNIVVPNTNSSGLFTLTRTSTTSLKQFRNTTILGSSTSTMYGSIPSTPISISNIGVGGGAFSTREQAFTFIGNGLSDSDVSNLYTSIQKFQTTLGRHVGTPYVSDPDAVAFLTAAGITDGTQAAAINTLVTRMKADGVWTKMKAIYPFVGGSATSHKFNLKDPRDLDAAYRLVFSGGWVHSSTGAKPNGTTGYADTKLAPNVMAQNSIHASFYSRTDITGSYWDLGAYNAGGGVVIGPRYQSGTSLVYMNIKSADGMADNNPTIGLYMGNRTSSTSNTLFRNGVIIVNGNKSSFAPISLNIYLGADNEGTILGYSPREQAFASIGDGLTDEEATNLYSTVQAYQTTLGRQVNVPLVSDTDAQAFLNAANITSFQQASAVNKLVTDLKSAGIWTKMKAIYPFVGGSATSHKWNLKDPRDLDAAYRLVFNGGWTHTSTGALPNGSNGYADTKLKPTDMVQNSAHMSTYLRTQLDNGVDMGCSTNYYFFISANQGASQPPRGPLNLYSFSYTGLNLPTQAFYLASRTDSTTNKLYRNTSIISNQTNTSSVPEAYNIYLGAGNRNNSIWQPSAREQAFSSIGDGLTDAEVTALYTAVQTYQTSLGRQVDTPVYNNGLVLNLDAGNANSYPGTGTTWFDLASGNNGTLTNGPTYDTANGGSLSFSTNKYVTIPTGDSYNFGTSDFTIEGWVNFNSITGPNDQIFVSKFTSWMSNLDFVFRFSFATPRITFLAGDLAAISLQNSYNITINTWYNYCVSRVSGVTTLYLNGIAQSSHTGSVNIPNDKKDIRLGYAQDNSEPLNGRMSGFKVYNRGLSSTEILNNFNSTRGRFGL